MVLALGSKQRLRGRGHGAYRPDLIIIDDYENDKNTQSSEQRQQLMELLDEAVAYAGDYYTDVIFIGTILHQESVLAQKLNNPLWDAKKFQSVLQWSARQDLWDEWEIIIQDRTNKERLADARRFYEAHEEEMLAGTLVVWPEKEDYYALMIELIRGGPAAFSKEKQNEPVNDEDCPFDVNRFGYYSDITEPYTCYGFVDPSMGDKETSDYSAILIVGVGQETGTRYVLEADIKRRKPDQIIADVLDYYQQYSFSAFEAENNGFQKFWLSKLVSALHAKGYWPLPEGVNHTGNKVARIKSLQPSLNDQSIRFKRTGQELLIEQLRYFPLASHDDGPDALEAVDELTKNNTQFIFGVL
jgi:predicted phage terminase large subunit-like protein